MNSRRFMGSSRTLRHPRAKTAATGSGCNDDDRRGSFDVPLKMRPPGLGRIMLAATGMMI